jgi:hypothetical protein
VSGVTGEMTMSKPTGWPTVLGFGDATLRVVVLFLLTVCVSGPPLLLPKLASPG